jgi:hypothetical protein
VYSKCMSFAYMMHAICKIHIGLQELELLHLSRNEMTLTSCNLNGGTCYTVVFDS